MSKRKGVSAEEKRMRMLQIFYEKKDFFQLKELEKIAPKEKGIIAQSVKDVVQSLVDDGLVDTDKIGTSTYFWAYPSKAKLTRKRKLNELEVKLHESTNKLKKAKEEINKIKENSKNESDKSELMEEITKLKLEKKFLLQSIQKNEDNDPLILQNIKKNCEATKDAANRWTDNIFNIKMWCKKKFMIEETTLNKQFGISPELDYIN